MAEHYFSEVQESPLKLRKIESVLRGHKLEFWTAGGVFSPRKVDNGSMLLANESRLEDGWDVLDLGCGYGAVGIAVARAFSKSKIVMTDINQRAIKIARMNKRLNDLKNISILQGSTYSKVKSRFDTILLNPPQSAGKKICFEMIEKAPDYLKEKGTLQIVARHSKGGKMLSEKMEKVFGNVEVIARKSGFKIYLSKN